jgi:hypothetical protein
MNFMAISQDVFVGYRITIMRRAPSPGKAAARYIGFMQVKGSPPAPRPWAEWTVKAVVAAIVVGGAGLLLLGLPGAVIIEFLQALGLARKLASDAVWPLAILTTVAGASLIVPASLTLRYQWPQIAGWAHVWRAALLALAATFVFAALAAR